MSRCFPFPPPGYEKKARSDDADLLKKEKHREKKHKKEKKNKEKKEEKEKREKERSNGKHKDKKDRKEKHGEKKKDKEKERDKDKDKNTISEEKRIAVQSERYNGDNLNQKANEGDKDKNIISEGVKDKNKLIRNGVLAEETGNSKFVQELGRRIRDDEKGARSQLGERLPYAEWRNDEQMDRVVVKGTGTLAGSNEKNKEKRVDNRKIDGQGFMGGARSSGSAVVHNFSGMVQTRTEGMPSLLENNIERRMEEKEKFKEKENGDKRGEKRKGKDREKKSHGKDKERGKEKTEEKVEEKSEYKTQDWDKFKYNNKNDHFGTWNIRTSHVAKDGDMNTATEGILKKRKDLEANGFFHDTDVRLNKMPRPGPHPLKENGRILEPCQAPILFTSDRLGPPSNPKANNKEQRKVNGVIEAQPLSISSKKSSSSSTQADQISQASMKPPHPDSKYLSQVLSVPRMEEWSDFDDQEWLFSSKEVPLAEKPNLGSSRVAEMPLVWAEALQIELADLCALPYVIPY
ncbi:hypothetical protein U1Q18_025111 [Sarracenia purpurea var. burkii]